MDLQSRVAQILNDPRLADDDADEEQLVAEYVSDAAPEAIYLLANEFGWQPLYDLLVTILRDDQQSERWPPQYNSTKYSSAGENLQATRRKTSCRNRQSISLSSPIPAVRMRTKEKSKKPALRP